MGRTRRGGSGAYTGRFFETHRSPEAVIPSLLSGQALSAVKDLRCARREILHCAQHDTSHLAGSFPKKPTRVRSLVVALRRPPTSFPPVLSFATNINMVLPFFRGIPICPRTHD